jgi:hypothetical protein
MASVVVEMYTYLGSLVKHLTVKATRDSISSSLQYAFNTSIRDFRSMPMHVRLPRILARYHGSEVVVIANPTFAIYTFATPPNFSRVTHIRPKSIPTAIDNTFF